MSEKQLSVSLHGKPVGVLSQLETGQLRFHYLPEPVQAISLGMPWREEAYENAQCIAYFGGLLPEGPAARQAIARHYGVNANNDFSLLKAIGHDCAGAVSLHLPDEPEETQTVSSRPARILSEAELALHIRELPQKPLFTGVDGLRLSLAGAQEKASICLVENRIALPQDGSPTTHILKPAIEQFEATVQNEYLCMRIAKRLGIETPEVSMQKAEGIPFLLVERYDREMKDSVPHRIHQEDFCQALGVPSALKYQADGGPGFLDCFNLLRRTTRPIPDRNKMAERMVFNYLISNRDAHGKNFSLLHVSPGLVQMTPAYDLLCVGIYDPYGDRMAMKIGGYYEEDKIQPRHWERLCREIGFSYPALKKIMMRQAEALLPAAEKERALLKEGDFNTDIADRILSYLDKQVSRVHNRFGI